LLGNVTQLPLEQRAFEWQPESCAITCLPPWLSTRARSSTAEDTCVLCDAEDGSYLCPDGHFVCVPLYGPYLLQYERGSADGCKTASSKTSENTNKSQIWFASLRMERAQRGVKRAQPDTPATGMDRAQRRG
jgi:hypothetical protein